MRPCFESDSTSPENMASLFSFLNRILPFATPGTPLVQDLIHLAAICGLLYYAPHIQDWVQHRRDRIVDADQEPPQLNGQPASDGDQGINEHEDNARNVDQTNDHHEQEHEAAEAADGHAPEPHPEDANEAAEAGPARVPDMPTQRNVGAKKAKSLARRDQRRAYHEFQRSQGEAQRALDAEGAAEREAAAAAERERRRATEAALEAKKARERELKREQDRKEREEEIRRRELVVSIVRRELEERSMCDLFRVARQVGGDVDEEWVEKILNASGLVGRKGTVVTTVTSMGWAVRVSEKDMAALYQTALDRQQGDDDGQVSYDALGSMLEVVLKDQTATAR